MINEIIIWNLCTILIKYKLVNTEYDKAKAKLP